MGLISYKLAFGQNLNLNKTFVRFCNIYNKPWSIVFFGSDNFSLFSLRELHKQVKKNCISLEVVVPNEKNSVYEYSKRNGLKIHLWPPFLNGTYDFGVIVSFGKFIPKSIIDKFPLGIINVHGSLLPKYRGGMPIVHAIKNGEDVTGVTVTKISHDKFDAGEIIMQKSCAIGKTELMPSLQQKLTYLGCDCLMEVLRAMPKVLETKYPQPSHGISYAPKLKRDAAEVKWSQMTALEIFNLYRSLFGMFELSSSWQGKQVRFTCLSMCDPKVFSSLDDSCKHLEPGCFIYHRKTKSIYVQCKNTVIQICTIRFNNKLLSANSFKKHMKKVSSDLWKFGN